MRIRIHAAALTGALMTLAGPASAQKTGDQSRLVFTVSAAYVSGTDLWHVPDQPVRGGSLDVGRAIQNKAGAAMAATYFKGANLGLTADVFIFELGYADACQQVRPGDEINRLGCIDIDESEHSALAAVFTLGAIYRVASTEIVSPYVRAGAGVLVSNQSSILTSGLAMPPGNTGPPVLLQVYNDDRKSRIGGALGLGVGLTTPISSGFQFRLELRDNILGIEKVDGASPENDFNPPHSVAFKHLLGVIAGVDLVLERHKGRRY
jgi:opacity protein-like surface antigen